MQIEVQCSKNYFKTFLPQEVGAFGKKIEMEPQKPRLNLKKYVCYTFTENTCSACNPMQMLVFCKKCIIFVDQRFKFFHFESSIIP